MASVANPKSPNRNAPVSGTALTGKRTKMVQTGRPETSGDRSVNTKSSNNTPNLSRVNQSRS